MADERRFGYDGLRPACGAGAQIANPEALVICVTGDASIQMNIQEMSTAVQYGLPVKVLILNNRHLGMVRQLQDVGYGGRYAESYSDALPDFAILAGAYGWLGIRVEGPQDLDRAIDEMLRYPGPVMVDCHVANLDNCFPMILAGASHREMLLSAASAPERSEAIDAALV